MTQRNTTWANIANKAKQMIKFRSVATGKEVKFPAFITKFSDDHSVSWGGTSVFGRTDPIKNYQSTGRRMSVSLDILGESEDLAKENFAKYSQLILMLYPTFSDSLGSAKYRAIKAPPLMRIKYANYIQSPTGNGLLGCITGIGFNPIFESGHFVDGSGNLIPLNYSINLQFEPLHEQTIGSDIRGDSISTQFPYNFNDEPQSGGSP
jgi:hypothetical protein